MPTKTLKLEMDRSSGKYRTRWTDDDGKRNTKTFGVDPIRAQIEFDQFYAKWLTDPNIRTPGQKRMPTTVREIVSLFDEHALAYYRKYDGSLTGEHLNFIHATRELLELYGDHNPERVDTGCIERVQEAMIDSGLSRNVVNARTRRIRHVFKWAYKKGMVSLDCRSRVQAAEAVKAYRTAAKETEAVTPVDDALVMATCEAASPTVMAMIMVQRLTGMRPGEVCDIKTGSLDMSGQLWVFDPKWHKTKYTGRKRPVLIGKQAQDYIRPYLLPDLMVHIFNPRISRHEQEVTHGRTLGRQKPRKTDRRVGVFYTTSSYYRAIQYACEKAGVPAWSPNQLRHSWASEARRNGAPLDAIQNGLGHSDRKTTEGYAHMFDDDYVAYLQKHG